MLPDGLYLVQTSYLCAGFVVKDGRVVQCAPILRRKLSYWMSVAKMLKTCEKCGTVVAVNKTVETHKRDNCNGKLIPNEVQFGRAWDTVEK